MKRTKILIPLSLFIAIGLMSCGNTIESGSEINGGING